MRQRLHLVRDFIAAVGMLLLAAIPASARSLTLANAMRDTPITRFNSADVRTMSETVRQALDSGADDVAIAWSNSATSSSGSVTPSKDALGRKHCRTARVENRHRSLQNSGSYLFCRSHNRPDGDWQLVEPVELGR